MMYLLDGDEIRRRREHLGWNQGTLADFAGDKVSERTVFTAESGEAVERASMHGIAAALQVDTSEIEWARIAPWQATPPLESSRARSAWSKALRLEMEGDPEGSIRLFDKAIFLLAKDPRASAEQRLELRLQRAAALGASGRSDESLSECESVAAVLAPESRLAHWVEYHRGIALRRLGRFDVALALFAELERRAKGQGDREHPFLPSILHQQGVVDLDRAQALGGSESKTALLASLGNFHRALEAWHGWDRGLGASGGHRVGFTWRRLGEVHRRLGQTSEAVRCLAEALTVLSWQRCRRYVEETQAQLRACVE